MHRVGGGQGVRWAKGKFANRHSALQLRGSPFWTVSCAQQIQQKENETARSDDCTTKTRAGIAQRIAASTRTLYRAQLSQDADSAQPDPVKSEMIKGSLGNLIPMATVCLVIQAVHVAYSHGESGECAPVAPPAGTGTVGCASTE